MGIFSERKRITFILIFIHLLLVQEKVLGQTNGDYRSSNPGNWADVNNWEYYNAGMWQQALMAPNQLSGQIEVRHQIIISADQVMDQVIVDEGAAILIQPGVMVTTTNSPASIELLVKGTVINAGMLFFSPSANMKIDSAGTYIHNSSVASSAVLDVTLFHPQSNWVYRGNGSLAPPVSISNRHYGNLIFESTAGNWSRTITGSSPASCSSLRIDTNVMIINNYTGAFSIQGSLLLTGALVNGSGKQKIILEGQAGDISGSNLVNFYDSLVIQPYSSYELLNNMSASTSSAFLVRGSLHCYSKMINGNNNGSSFILQAGAWLKTSHAMGVKGSVNAFSLPVFSDDACYEFSGDSNQEIGLYNYNVRDLKINCTTGTMLSLKNNTSVKENLYLQKGIILTQPYALLAEGNIVGGNDSSFIRGSLSRKIPPSVAQHWFFPLGGIYYHPLTLRQVNCQSSTHLKVDVFESVPAGSPDGISIQGAMADRYYQLKTTGTNGITAINEIVLSLKFISPALTPSSKIGCSPDNDFYSYHGLGGLFASDSIRSVQAFTDCYITELSSVDGIFIGIAEEGSPGGIYTDSICYPMMQIKAFIQGFYTGNGMMKATIDPLLSPSICDSIEIELHSAAFPFELNYQFKSTVSISGMISLDKSSVSPNFYFIVLKHRNALETWSSVPVYFHDTLMSYDFSDSASKAFGNNLADLGDGRFAIYSGDLGSTNDPFLKDGIIDMTDLVQLENALHSFSGGYIRTDITGDQLTDLSDQSMMENNIILGIQVIKP
jgi:hypothetical protein